MAYGGNVALINGLIPANGQNFPLVHMNHVYIDDDTRLSNFIDNINGEIEDLKYVPLTINSFTFTNPENGIVEKGSTVTSVSLNYSCNKKPAILGIDNNPISNPPISDTITLTGLSVTSNRTFTLRGSDEGSHSIIPANVTKTATLYFYDKIHWGASEVPNNYDDSFILTGLTNHELAANKKKTFTVTAGANMYIYFALPTSMGTPTFTSGGFDGGFTKVAQFSHTNSTGSTSARTNYAVWKSDNPNLGLTTVAVS